MTYTPEQIAQVCHEANRALRAVHSDLIAPGWAMISDDMRESAIAGVQTALDGATPKQLHEAWTERKVDTGWRYGEVADEQAKTHPCLVDYDELPERDQDKDLLFAAIVGALGEVAPRPLRLDERHPSVSAVLRFLEVNPRLPKRLAAIASMFRILAVSIADLLPDGGPELTVALRKLLEAKDAAVRAAL